MLIGTTMLFHATVFASTTLAPTSLFVEFGAIFLAIGVVFAVFSLLGAAGLVIFLIRRRRPKRRLGWQKA